MHFKKKFVILCLAIVMIFCSCDKKSLPQNNSSQQESNNTISTEDKKEDSLEVNEDTTQKKEQSNPELQQILDNNEFINSFEGTQYQINAYYFVKAFLNGDYKYIQENLVDTSKLDKYDYKDQFTTTECMYFRLREYDKQEQLVHGEYAIQLTKDSGYIYLEFNMQLIDGTWKIIDYQLEA